MSGICFRWRDTGRCPFPQCKFRHDGPPGRGGGGGGGGGGRGRGGGGNNSYNRGGGTGRGRGSSPSSFNPRPRQRPQLTLNTKSNKDEDLRRIIRHLAVVKTEKLGDELFKSSLLWRRCWQSWDSMDDDSKRYMLEILARIPGSSSVDPPSIQHLQEVVQAFLDNETKAGASDDKVLTAVKTVLNVVERVLDFAWLCRREQVKEGLEKIITSAESRLRKQNKDHRPVSKKLMETLDDLEKPWRIQQKESVGTAASGSLSELPGGGGANDADGMAATELSYDQWQNATVKWLCNPDFFAPSRCPKMNVGQNGVYESAEDYMNCVSRLWVAMTFADGHASLAPHCRARGQSGTSCGNALWPVAVSDFSSSNLSTASLRCRTRGCPSAVEFCCRIKSHDSLCGGCAARSFANHLGGPGPNASTHIYDCKVETVQTDGVVYLKNFQSRNPPQKPIHWRTTKRLSPPNLVGIVRLESRGSALAESDAIKWGEIVFHGDHRNEERRRLNGELAVNLFSIVEHFDLDYFEECSTVAVIDCMCFVPEWIPVLKALDNQKLTRLPFDNGRYLNLWRGQPVTPSTALDVLANAESVFASDRTKLIEMMVQESQLEPIREIRRDASLTDSLVARLVSLVTVTTLDKMQLLSFVDSLRNPVHLTQGPPGTGKSYLGVVLVRALIIIRDLWQQKSSSVGLLPILVLSYKNHAIDEFLVDLVNSEPSIKRSMSLIRIGGQCKDTRLSAFSERGFYDSDRDVCAARQIVDNLLALKESVQYIVDGNVSSFLAFRHQVHNSDDPQIQRKAVIDATRVLMEAIVRKHLLEAALKSVDQDTPRLRPKEIANDFKFLILKNDGAVSDALAQQVNTPDGSVFVPTLLKGVSHCPKENWGDTLFSWLCGRMPRPRCRFSHAECKDLALSTDVPFCERHRCRGQVETERCSFERKDESSAFCANHACQADGCQRCRLDQQGYCSSHVCRRCLELGRTSELAIDLPPRNVCEEHPLCVHFGCLDFCLEEGNYCSKHSEIKCEAVTKKRGPCKGKPLSRFPPFCKDHMHLAREWVAANANSGEEDVQAVPGDAEKSESRCEMIKRNKERCKGTCLPGLRYCSDHAGPVIQHPKQALQVTTRCSWVKQNQERCKGLCVPGQQYCLDHSGKASGNAKQHEKSLDVNGAVSAVEPKPSTAVGSPEGCDETMLLETEGREPAKPVFMIEEALQLVGGHSFDSKSATSDTISEGGKTLTQAADVNEDEASLESEEEGENLQHLRDIFEVTEGVENEPENASVHESEQVTERLQTIAILSADPKEWDWEVSPDSRWELCQGLMEELRGLLGTVAAFSKASITRARRHFQLARVRAKAKAYENKSVIGGTMVGCISRLESIRKTRPFAVLVEEASEVLEPLLFSCLSESTVKLELVGDHRQLQPSLMSRFDFEIMNKVNVSMFQRLIEAPPGHAIPSTVLSVQRRMRKNLCDLTRDFYKDIVEIEDHETCLTQVIGKRKPTGTNNNLTPATATGGREVPGVSPHVFLWTHGGEQGRAHVGISRINEHEARMACSLAAYLIECGVPKPSIVLLTPYKGQLMHMRNLMMKDTRLSSYGMISKNPSEANVCRLSTVDRFQGDEEDIVICSLVVDENSKTGFVKLQNRMIVLLSRARLGLYILGNIGYFQSNGVPSHWSHTFELLRAPALSDSSDSVMHTHTGERSGSRLPLCCPLHRYVTTSVDSPGNLRLGFCTEVCQHALVCGHSCSLRCHWPKTAHNSACSHELDSPCGRHPGRLQCFQIFQNSKSAPPDTKHTDISQYYNCPCQVEMPLSCSHVLNLPCYQERQMTEGKLSVPQCKQNSPTPYTFPSCGHTKAVKCYELVQFNTNPHLVKCDMDASFEPPCGHTKSMKCWRKVRFEEKKEVFVCDRAVTINLPRCGHEHKVTCETAQQISCWSGKACEEVGTLVEGSSYGPQDFSCQNYSAILRPCGHKLILPCVQAFARVAALQPCREKVPARHPGCGHPCQLACHAATDLKVQGTVIPDPTYELKEGESNQAMSSPPGFPTCRAKVKVVRKCGHTVDMVCAEARKPLPGCKETSTIQSRLCGHLIVSPCFLRRELESPLWPSETFQGITDDHRIALTASPCRYFDSLSEDAKKILRSCQCQTVVLLDCGHGKSVNCSTLIDLFTDPSKSGIRCEVPVPVQLNCGHVTETSCVDAKLSQSGKLKLLCKGTRVQKCWNFSVCQSSVKVDCGFVGTVACDTTLSWSCGVASHDFRVKLCSIGEPLDCPGCSMDRLSSAIQNPMAFAGETELRNALVDLVPNDLIEWVAAPLSEFISSERELLSRYRNALQDSNVWEHPLFQLSRVPCFRVLTKRNKKMRRFDPKHCVNGDKSLFGISTRFFHASNLRKLAASGGDNQFTLLVGYASVLRPADQTTSSIPTGPKPRSDLVFDLMKKGHDSMIYVDEKNCEALVVWDPFPLVALCRLKLSAGELLKLGEKLSLPGLDLASKYISFRAPSKQIKVFATSKEDDSDNESTVDERDQDAKDRLKGTVFEEFVLNIDWIDGICSNGRLKPKLEKNLLTKMEFANPHATPFSAIQLLRTLTKQKPDEAVLHLLSAAEMTKHSLVDAQKSFDAYLSSVRRSTLEDNRIHPWSLIVAARLNQVQAKQLLTVFADLFPLQTEKYLTAAERALVSTDGANEHISEDAKDALLEEWADIRAKYPGDADSDAMDELLKLTGLRKVKKEALLIWKSALLLRKMDAETRAKNQAAANYCFLGNPGTGKSTVARIFARILCDAGIRENNVIVETTAQESKDLGSDEFRKLAKSAHGGVLFVDEAYDLDPIGDYKGKPIVNELLTLCENERNNISVILAGYEDECQKKLWAYNEGLKSRFRKVLFEDFDEQELSKIWNDMRAEKKWNEEERVCSVAAKRIVKKAGRKGFGNAREIRLCLENATRAAMARLGDKFSMDTMVIKIEDVIGKDPRLESEKLKAVLREIEEMIGWGRVKTKVREVAELCGLNYQRELLGQPPLPFLLSRLFLGNPGTGKTTCAKLYGKLLKELGFLSNGDIVSKTASDFVGSAVGESQKNTNLILDAARGKVLIIDEAYALDDSLYGKQVLDTLVEKVQGTPSDDIAVLLLGYEPQMVKMIEGQNPGLARRFPIDHAFCFDDYSDQELLQILRLNLKQQEVGATLGFMEKATQVLQIQKSQANFGNAGAIDLLLKGAMQMASERSKASTLVLDDVDIQDPGTSRAGKHQDPLSLLDGLYRMEKVKAKLEKLRKTWDVELREGNNNGLELGHFVFLGSPGTGKTTVARAISDVLFGLSLISTNKFVEKSALDLTADHAGQTKTKVQDALKEARGGILFVDEAYNLGQGPYGKEACATLAAAMTSEEFRDVLIVIAGYRGEINTMLDSNAELKSRFTNFFELPDWEPDDCVSFFKMCADKESFVVEDDAIDSLREGCSRLQQLSGWANGRDVKKLWSESKSQRAERVHAEAEWDKKLKASDINVALSAMIQARVGKLSDWDPNEDPLARLDALFRMDQIKEKLERLKKAWAVARREGSGPPNLGHFIFTGSPGTGKTTVARAISRVLFGLQLKPSDKLVETTALDMTACYEGQTSNKVNEILKDAKGGMLFIDEAYNLGQGQFGKEACDTLVAGMTSNEYRDVQIVLAGYPHEIDGMFRTNRGLKGRFKHFFEFPDWTPADCVEFFQMCAGSEGFASIDKDVEQVLLTGFTELVAYDGWANGRDVTRLWEEAKSLRAVRVYDEPPDDTGTKAVIRADVETALSSMLQSRRPKPRKRSADVLTSSSASESPLASLRRNYATRGIPRQAPAPPPTPLLPPPLKQVKETARVLESSTADRVVELLDEAVEHEYEEKPASLEERSLDRNQDDLEMEKEECHDDDDDDDDDNERRDNGVPDHICLQLQDAKKREQLEHEERLRIWKALEQLRKMEEEARIRHEQELERIRLELEREEQEKARRLAEEEEERHRAEAERKQKELEERKRKMEEEMRQKEAIQKKLIQIGSCPMGYQWHQVGGGWRCAGGSHFVSDEQLKRQFGFEVDMP